MVKISEEKFRMTAGRHIWIMTDHENDGFNSRNLNSKNLFGKVEKELSNHFNYMV